MIFLSIVMVTLCQVYIFYGVFVKPYKWYYQAIYYFGSFINIIVFLMVFTCLIFALIVRVETLINIAYNIIYITETLEPYPDERSISYKDNLSLSINLLGNGDHGDVNDVDSDYEGSIQGSIQGSLNQVWDSHSDNSSDDDSSVLSAESAGRYSYSEDNNDNFGQESDHRLEDECREEASLFLATQNFINGFQSDLILAVKVEETGELSDRWQIWESAEDCAKSLECEVDSVEKAAKETSCSWNMPERRARDLQSAQEWVVKEEEKGSMVKGWQLQKCSWIYAARMIGIDIFLRRGS